jgi:DNA mismatch repair protein MutS2
MDRRSLELLEFPLIRSRLAGLTGFEPSRRLASALEPSSDAIVVRRALDQTDAARDLLSRRPEVGIGAAHDIGAHVRRARRGGRLAGTELVEVLETITAAGRLGEALVGERNALLHGLGQRITPLPQLRASLERSLDPAGELLDSASPRLGGLRRAVRLAQERLQARLERMVHGGELSGALQEPLVTLRNGRYVLPVRAEAKGRVKGIVHDQSGSGQTLFIEPLAVVELGNAWREAQLAVETEQERILDELSTLVATHADGLDEALAALAEFDFWAARARLAADLDGIRATESADASLELLSARHPGLTGRVVPIDVRLGGDFSALVITGPNTGGKTVTLRTIGLLALMNQAGLHIPAAAGSRLPILRAVYADVGDEQSIAQSLSTFSSHMSAIVRIVDQAGAGDLVLLDELGAGTDPTEGSALAQALLDHFIRAGVLVAATTHYAELKTYAHNTAAATNASVDFDLATLSPTYHLSIGLPGTSHAFAIAERLGLPLELVTDARARLGRAEQEFEATLTSIRAARLTTEAALERAVQAEERARAARSEAEAERSRARRERDSAAAEARAEAERALVQVQAEIRAARDALARSSLTEGRLEQTVAQLEQRVAALLPGAAEQARSAPPSAPEELPLLIGTKARTPAGWQGRITTLDEHSGQATLEAGSLRVTVPLADLVAVTAKPAGHPPRADEPAPSRLAARAVPASLDLRGTRVEEALELLDRYLDSAAVAGAPRVTIIHGHGSGALRDALRAAVAASPLVSKWRAGERGEGGDGATIVEL